jgi:uncharacterized protein YjbI with pentapeptide repeats
MARRTLVRSLALMISLLALLVLCSSAMATAPPLSRTKDELEVAKLREEVRQLRIENAREGSLRHELLNWVPFATVLLGVFGIVLPVMNELRQQRNQRAAELKQRKLEEQRRFDDLFAQAVANLGSTTESVQVSAAIALKSFLRNEYEALHQQVQSVLRANLAVDHSQLVNRFIIDAFEDAVRLLLESRRDQPASELTPLDLARCRMPRIDLHGLDLGEDVDLAFAILKDANLRGTQLVRAKGVQVVLERAHLSDANLKEARFHGAACRGARFHNATLVSAEFKKTTKQRADLRSAEFFGAKLQGAHFEQADLTGAHFDNANVADAFFLGAIFDDATLRSVLATKVVNDVPTWQKAHFDGPVTAQLAELQRRPRKRSQP